MIETASMNLSVFAVLFLGCVSSVSSVRAFIPTHLAVRRTLNVSFDAIRLSCARVSVPNCLCISPRLSYALLK